jgi:isopenicillin-N epimerase
VGALAAAAACRQPTPQPDSVAAPIASAPPRDLSSWEEVRASFRLREDRVHLAGMLLASHPTPVREALERYREALDRDPVSEVHRAPEREAAVYEAAARYTGASAFDLALTDSTTMGLGLVYTGLKLAAGDEVVTTTHDHYSTHESLRYATARAGATVKQVPLYDSAAAASAGEMVARLTAAITPATRLVAVTWVHSSTGVKLPIAELARVVGDANASRARPILLSVDGVHGFGIEAVELPSLGCDVFVAGTHKWIFGPRGTGLVWSRAWSEVAPTIPPFNFRMREGDQKALGRHFSPGGFHSFEHRWALAEAFAMHLAMGKARVEERIHALASQAKEGLAKMAHVTLHTPRSAALSSGIVCFEVAGLKPKAVVARLLDEHSIIASETPYAQSYARFSPALFNTPEEIDKALGAVQAMM